MLSLRFVPSLPTFKENLSKSFHIYLSGDLFRSISLSTSCQKCVTYNNMNPALKSVEFSIRGPIVIRAIEIEKEIENGSKKPFNEVIKANIGDCHAMGQVPITFVRQVLALISLPALFNDPLFSEDVKKRAKEILAGCRGGSIGSYSDSPGIEMIRKHVAQYIEKRDGGIPCDWQNIILSEGASNGIKSFLKLLIENVDGKKAGVMIPIPKYPLYSASLAKFNMVQAGYYLNEENGWSIDTEELKRAYKEAKSSCTPRAIVVINPGNPTGQVLTRKNMEEIIKFACEHKLFFFADEVCQENIYGEACEFHSFKKVMTEMGSPYSEMELVSFMSTSSGYWGECGLRGAASEIINMDSQVKAMLLKSVSVMLCPTILGQAAMDCVVNPPRPGEPSYKKFKAESDGVLKALANSANMITDTFNTVPGMSCNPVQGSLYAFPRIELPAKAVAEAESLDQCPSTFYAIRLLEDTGICVVPGSGFGQKPGTYHFRMITFPQLEKLRHVLDNIKRFHLKFLEDYK